jgi:hypothetical protein
MVELVEVRADAVAPGEQLCIGGALLLITAVEAGPRVVDLHTEYGPALRLLRTEWVTVAAAEETTAAA